MPNDIKPRNIRILRELTVSKMTDEEIVKAVMDRLKSRAVMLVYENPDDNWGMIFLGRYRKGGRLMHQQLQLAWEEKFGKWKKLDQEEE